jgi:hypothetical protein
VSLEWSLTFLAMEGKTPFVLDVGGLSYGLAPILGILLPALADCFGIVDLAGLEFQRGLLAAVSKASDSRIAGGRITLEATIGNGNFELGRDEDGAEF